MRLTLPRAAIAAAVAVAALPAAAGAATVSQEGNVLVYTAASGEANSLRLVSQGTSVVDFLEQGSVKVTSATSLCVPAGSGDLGQRSVRCGLSTISRIDVRLGDRADFFGTFHPIPIVYDAGSGDDTYGGSVVKFGSTFDSPGGSSQVDYRGGSGQDTATYNGVSGSGVIVDKDERPFDGRAGIDRDNVRGDVELLEGSSQGDALAGGNGPETFISSGGADTLNGRGGNDLFVMGSRKDGATTVIGGPDRDRVSYVQRQFRVNVSPDSDSSADGEVGENDRISETEIIEGGQSNDVLVVDQNSTIGYELIGNGRDDFLVGGSGSDKIVGGPGVDIMTGGRGNDGIVSLDGNKEQVDCGTGGDGVRHDLTDRLSSCESRDNGLNFIGKLSLTPAAGEVDAGGSARLRVSWTHPESWRKLRSVRVVLRDGKRVIGEVTVKPREGRVDRRGAALRALGGPARRGDTVSARLVAHAPEGAAGRQLSVDVIATDVAGKRQTETDAASLTTR